jgi:hypothetical protein
MNPPFEALELERYLIKLESVMGRTSYSAKRTDG